MRIEFIAVLMVVSACVLTADAADAKEAGTIRGRVFGADGEPVPEAEVIARGSHGGRVLLRPVVRTDRKGRYLLERLPAGEWKIAIRAAGHAPAVRSELVMKEGVSLAGIDFTLDEGRSVEGRIVDAEGRPVGLEPIEISSHGFPVPGVAKARTRTDADGRFRFEHLADLAFSLTMGSERVGRYRQDVHPDESPVTLRVEVLGDVSGEVAWPGGADSPKSFRVVVIPTGATTPYPTWIEPSPFRTVKDAVDGRFLVKGFRPGLYDVIVVTEDAISNRAYRVRIGGGRVAAIETPLTLRKTGSLDGRVVGTENDEVAGARVALLTPEGKPAAGWSTTAETPRHGVFQLHGIPAGDYILRASAPGGRSASVRIEVVAGERKQLDVTVR